MTRAAKGKREYIAKEMSKNEKNELLLTLHGMLKNHHALTACCFTLPPNVTRQSSRAVKKAVVAEYKRVLARAKAVCQCDTLLVLGDVKKVGLEGILVKVRHLLKENEQCIGEMLARDRLKASKGEERAQKRLRFLEYALSFRSDVRL